MTPPASARCAHCGAEISPAATVCGFCQKPVGLTWLLRPIMSGLFGMLILGLLAAVTLWLNTSLRLVVAARQTVAALTAKAPTPPAPAEPDPQYAGMLAQAEREIARGDYRLAVAMLMQALTRRPDRPEARARLERLRTELMNNRQVVPTAMGMGAPPLAPMAAAQDADMGLIPGGPFTMGASEPGGNVDEYPAHEVTLSPFWIEAREVTVELYSKFCAQTQRRFPRQPAGSSPRHPVVSVTWSDAQAYCRHQDRRLPTEAEWERAARCGSKMRAPNGGPPFFKATMWFADNSEEHAHPVGTKLLPPNGCGLSDAYGNVWEWVADWYSASTYDNSPRRDPRGPRSGEEKVLRGGAFDSPPEAMTATFREKFSPDYGAENRGFRCARSASP